MIDRLLSTLAPHICCNCRNVGSLLCESCTYDIVEDRFGQCVECLIPTYSSQLCKSCRAKLPFDDAFVVSSRSGSLKNLINSFKFDRGKEAARHLAGLLDKTLPELPPGAVIVPIPTLGRHRRMRGYGHTELVASLLAKQRSTTSLQLLDRTTSAVQHGKTRAERVRQAKGMFRLSAELPHTPILLLDDIYTTGSTVRSAGLLLRGETQAPLYLAIIARQPLDDSIDLW